MVLNFQNEFDEILSNGPQFGAKLASNDDLLFETKDESFLYGVLEKDLNVNVSFNIIILNLLSLMYSFFLVGRHL